MTRQILRDFGIMFIQYHFVSIEIIFFFQTIFDVVSYSQVFVKYANESTRCHPNWKNQVILKENKMNFIAIWPLTLFIFLRQELHFDWLLKDYYHPTQLY